jgi:hypothetical protein
LVILLVATIAALIAAKSLRKSGNAAMLKQDRNTHHTWVHVAATDSSDGENKGGVSKAVAKGGDSEAMVNTGKICTQNDQVPGKK